MSDASTTLADLMLDRATFQLRPDRPVRWASGALMPVYNDNRRLLADPHARSLVADLFVELIAGLGISPVGVIGVATGGIVPATTLADRLGVRLYYARSAPKDHGLGRQVEGVGDDFTEGELVLVEDLVSSGGSCAGAVEAARKEGARLRHGLCVFSYEFERADRTFAGLGDFTMHPVITVAGVIQRASERTLLNAEQLSALEAWCEDPFGWDSRHAGDDDA
jgi:orotate phosphoribosyltransferase